MPDADAWCRLRSSATANSAANVIAIAIATNAYWNVPVVSRTHPMKQGIRKPDDTPILVIKAMPVAAARSVKIRLGICQKVEMLQKHADVPIANAMIVLIGESRYSAVANDAPDTSSGPAT